VFHSLIKHSFQVIPFAHGVEVQMHRGAFQQLHGSGAIGQETDVSTVMNEWDHYHVTKSFLYPRSGGKNDRVAATFLKKTGNVPVRPLIKAIIYFIGYY
jgi:hypothetical protein